MKNKNRFDALQAYESTRFSIFHLCFYSKLFSFIDLSIYFAQSKYTNHCGYPTYLIEKVLIEQAQKNANCFYLGSLNGFYGNPKIWQHYHVALFIPYEENGKTKIAVLERNKETSFSYLLKRYPNTYCHLVKISAEGDFELMSP